jgi:hypothetical protein
MGVGSAVCMMAEGARCVEDGLRRSARKGGGEGGSLSSGALVYLHNGGWGGGREGSGGDRASRKQEAM